MTEAQKEAQKSEYKTLLEKAGTTVQDNWYSQNAHKAAVAMKLMDLCGIKDKDQRQKIALDWMKNTPPSFGANASALGQQLGRPTQKAKMDATFGEF